MTWVADMGYGHEGFVAFCRYIGTIFMKAFTSDPFLLPFAARAALAAPA
jgi:hypothetical protein